VYVFPELLKGLLLKFWVDSNFEEKIFQIRMGLFHFLPDYRFRGFMQNNSIRVADELTSKLNDAIRECAAPLEEWLMIIEPEERELDGCSEIDFHYNNRPACAAAAWALSPHLVAVRKGFVIR